MGHFQNLGSSEHGYVSNVYVPLNPEEKRGFIGEIYHLGQLMQAQPWILRGDFNLIISLE